MDWLLLGLTGMWNQRKSPELVRNGTQIIRGKSIYAAPKVLKHQFCVNQSREVPPVTYTPSAPKPVREPLPHAAQALAASFLIGDSGFSVEPDRRNSRPSWLKLILVILRYGRQVADGGTILEQEAGISPFPVIVA